MVRRRRYPEVRIRSSSLLPILALVVRLAPSEGVGVVCLADLLRSDGFFVIVGVILGQSLLIYGCPHWLWLLLWCASLLEPWPSVHYNKLYYGKLCSTPVMEGRGQRGAFGSRKCYYHPYLHIIRCSN
jgi:hypothetical protein